MNERITFLVAAITAGLSAAVLPCLFSPSGPLCVGSDLLNYTGEHFFLAVGLWLLVFAAAWLVAGRRLVRPRQNLSTKLRLLIWSGVVGIFIDNAVSLYQFESSSQPDIARIHPSALLPGLAERSLLYAIIFAAAVGLSYVIASRQKPTVTPPPRFGRE